ncbi:LysR substrate-binding domain-containing protein [Grimontia kaedaensis]|uniref:LysR substrate-binding domain-containing protein n=1 Tax=Grimontia kaedaensis TaxID=2872157 RepID=UPI0021120513|nr:LysR substrate-binding domain-containing protein [Grimontia kaedaensis]
MSRCTPSYKSLEVFLAVARTQSYFLAGEEMCIDATGVYKHIKTVENYFDQRLVLGSKGNVKLSEAGKQLAKQLNDGFEIINSACSTLKKDDSLNVKLPISFGLRWLLPNTHDNFSLASEFGQFHFHVAYSHTIDFADEDFDMAVVYTVNSKDQKFYDEQLVAVAKPEYLETLIDASWPELLKHGRIIHPSSTEADWEIFLDKLDMDVRQSWCSQRMMTDSISSAISIVKEIGGIAVVDPLFIQNELATGELVMVTPEVVPTGFGYKLAGSRVMPDEDAYRFLEKWLTENCLFNLPALSQADVA